MKIFLYLIILLSLSNSVFGIDLSLESVKAPSGFYKAGKIQMNINFLAEIDEMTVVPVKIYYSNDDVISSDDTLLIDNNINMYSSGIGIWNSDILLQGLISKGEYIIAILDWENKYSETNESNNTAVLKVDSVKGIIDLNILAPVIKQQYLQNESYEINLDITNVGSTSLIGDFSIISYLSTDSLLSSEDEILGSETETLDFFLRRLHRYTYNFIPKKPAGKYYIISKVALDNLRDENPGNNLLITPITILQKNVDLYVSSLKLKNAVVSKGFKSTFEVIVKNSGSTSFLNKDSITYSYYVTADTILKNTDPVWIKSTSKYLYNNIAIDFPASFSGDVAYIHVSIRLKPIDTIQENDTTNNTKVLKVIFSNPSPDASIGNGVNKIFHRTESYIDIEGTDNSENYSFSIQNKGNVDITDLTLSIYFSKDTILSIDDNKINSTIISAVKKESEITHFPNLQPNDFPMGKNYIIVLADSSNIISEFSESNNLYYFEYIKSDPRLEFSYESVYIDDISLETKPADRLLTKKASDSLKVYFSLMLYEINLQEPITALEVGIYFSEDKHFDITEDLHLSTTDYKNNISNFPLDKITSSQGYILVMIDPYQKYDEYSRTNNLNVFPILFNSITSVSEMVYPAMKIYPNPCQDVIYINEEAEEIRILDFYGHVIVKEVNTKEIFMSDIPSGIYFMEILKNNSLKVEKVMKQ